GELSHLCARPAVAGMPSKAWRPASQRIATDVSRPPEYARTTRCMWFLPFHPFLELPREGLRLAVTAADHQDRVLRADRPHHFRQAGAIDRLGQGIRLSAL